MHLGRPQTYTEAACRGSGIAGLSLVNALQRYCDMSLLEVTLFEAARHLSPKGAGIVLYQRPQRILREIGLGAGLEKYVSDHSDISTCS